MEDLIKRILERIEGTVDFHAVDYDLYESQTSKDKARERICGLKQAESIIMDEYNKAKGGDE